MRIIEKVIEEWLTKGYVKEVCDQGASYSIVLANKGVKKPGVIYFSKDEIMELMGKELKKKFDIAIGGL